MGLFYNNNVAGSGVAKKKPKKNPFFRFWELFFNKFWTLFLLNLIYVLFCLPVVTFGPATAALTAMIRNIYLERPQFVWHDFLKEFKKNFNKSVAVGIVDLGVAAVVIITFFQMLRDQVMDVKFNWLYVLSLSVLAVFVMMNFYIYPQIVALDMKLRDIVKNSLILVFVNVLPEILTLALFVGFVSLFYFFGFYLVFLLPFIPGAWMVFVSVNTCYPTIQRMIIEPYYDKIGEINPEIPDWELDDEDSVFEDMGGVEEPIDLRAERKASVQAAKNGKGGRVIK